MCISIEIIFFLCACSGVVAILLFVWKIPTVSDVKSGFRFSWFCVGSMVDVTLLVASAVHKRTVETSGKHNSRLWQRKLKLKLPLLYDRYFLEISISFPLHSMCEVNWNDCVLELEFIVLRWRCRESISFSSFTLFSKSTAQQSTASCLISESDKRARKIHANSRDSDDTRDELRSFRPRVISPTVCSRTSSMSVRLCLEYDNHCTKQSIHLLYVRSESESVDLIRSWCGEFK